MNQFQDLLGRQKRHFATGVTRSYAWRIEQLSRMARLVGENEAALQRAVGQYFKTASQEQVFETLACLGEVEFQKSQLKDWRVVLLPPGLVLLRLQAEGPGDHDTGINVRPFEAASGPSFSRTLSLGRFWMLKPPPQ
jgi:hypothetical protein